MEIVGINEVNYNSLQVSIFPNPAKDHLTIVAESEAYKVSIFSADNSFQQDFTTMGQSTQIPLSHLPMGVYFIKVLDLNNGRMTFERVVKY